MSKYIKLFKDGYDPEVETLHLYENRPFIGYSETDEKVIYTEDIPYFYVESLVEDNAAGLGLFIVESILSLGGACLKVSTNKITWIDVMTVLGAEAVEVTELGLSYSPKLYPILIPLGIGQRLYFNLEADSICPLENFSAYYASSMPTVGCFGPFSVGGVLTTFTNGVNNYTSGYNTYTYGGFFTALPVCHALELILPCTGLVDGSFFYMFSNCTYLETGPNLLNTTLTNGCCSDMFQNCTSLTTAPELPATTLADYCYSEMFQNCTSLTTAPELPATTLANYCYQYMFKGCTSLTTAPELPATTLAEQCYNYMFDGCTSLTQAPSIIPAITVKASCCAYMFLDCTSLVEAPELSATTLALDCYSDMFQNCTSLTTAPELPATELADNCYSGMFQNCTSLTTAPELPATTLANYCYQYMFYGCTNLNHIACLATDISAYNCTYNWVYGVASTGTFVKHSDMNNWSTGTKGIPSGWSVEGNYTPQECVKLELTANNVSGRKTNTTIYYTATTNGIDYKGDRVEGQIITGTATSTEFEQNKSYTDAVERTITFEFMGVTATTTITQGVWVDQEYEVVLNDQWRLSETQSNPDSTLYEGVYESFSNKGVNNSTATMYLDLIGYTEFDVYIRSYAESKYDYVTISEPNSTTEKANTKSKQNSGQDISSYTNVHYDNLTGEDRITITYRKDSSSASGNDQGYVLIPKQ